MSEEKSFFEKNMAMWERWTSSYMDTMAAAMDKTMEQSATLRKQIDKAVATAVGTQMDAALAAIRSLEKQIDALAGKIDEMLDSGD